ncbi:hypothetical protein JB92DRAFT_1647121 [Gautieria morchelliformis]|nr:hypothetical protein JB92DRAFT_1647121 [Gautieria morchelliformis]
MTWGWYCQWKWCRVSTTLLTILTLEFGFRITVVLHWERFWFTFPSGFLWPLMTLGLGFSSIAVVLHWKWFRLAFTFFLRALGSVGAELLEWGGSMTKLTRRSFLRSLKGKLVGRWHIGNGSTERSTGRRSRPVFFLGIRLFGASKIWTRLHPRAGARGGRGHASLIYRLNSGHAL